VIPNCTLKEVKGKECGNGKGGRESWELLKETGEFCETVKEGGWSLPFCGAGNPHDVYIFLRPMSMRG